MDNNKIVTGLSPLERKALPFLDKYDSPKDIAKASGMQEVEVMRALQWFSNKEIIKLEVTERNIISLGNNGKEYVKKGLPEKRFLKALVDGPLSLQNLEKKSGLNKQEVGACIGVLKKKIAIEMKDGKLSITDIGKKAIDKEDIEEVFMKKIAKETVEVQDLAPEEKFALENLKKRKDIIIVALQKDRKAILTDLGKELTKIKLSDVKVVENLTQSMLKDGSWKGKTFRRYDVKINVPPVYGGKRHFVNQSIRYIKRIWMDLGFKEMEGNMVQTSYWDLDSLFVPQDHPARQMQDTFYLGEKDILRGTLPKEHSKIKDVHENGADTGSTGWMNKWSEDEAKKVLLRTHTTVLSAQTIAKLKETDLPAKFFSVNKVFRNESLDWKHLFEFYQVEGIVVDPDANLKHLKGYLREFFGKMGYPDVRMRPAHFPYTEPSMEVDVWHPIKKQWVELGGAGIFRPEVVKPLLGKDVPVLAWGLGMPRIISGYFGITDIRDLYKNDLKQIREMKAWMK